MTKPFALIVEDDPHLGSIFAITLQEDFDTEIASDGSTGLIRLAQTVPDIVVLDLNLPDMDGKDILENIRKDSRFCNTRVILCTADVRLADTLQEKADIVLLKPVSPAQLRQMALRLTSN